MNAERFKRIEGLYQSAIDLPPDDRQRFLQQECGDDVGLRGELEAMLGYGDSQLQGVLSTPVLETTSLADTESTATPPERVGPYTILRQIGAGGMGVVYEAKQENPHRTVALKVIRPELTSEEMLKRFRYEAEVLGQLLHPGIAQIYEAGTAEVKTESGMSAEQPFFAMELVRGQSIDAFVDSNGLGTRARLELVARVCDAVHHAPQKGVIHRDPKPGNILVDEPGQPKILDFGVARATDSDIRMTTLRTDVGQLIGTIPYMSPEQATGATRDLDTRSDVYALGVIGYEVLSGKTPFEMQNLPVPEAIRMIREDTPAHLSSIDKLFRGDVETIIERAMEKDKERRYQSASDLAADIRRYLCDEPIVARPPSAIYQFRKFAKRNKALVTAIVAVMAAFAAGTTLAVVGLVRASASATEALRQTGIAQAAEQEQSRARKEADKARAEAETARDQTQVVADFQSSMLGETDAEGMGLAIVDGFEERIRAALAEQIEDQGELDRVMHEWRQLTLKAGPTTVALGVLDEFVLAKAAETIEQDFADQPLVRAALEQTVADTYVRIALYERAMPLQEAALQLRREELGDDHSPTLTSINNMGQLLQSMGKYAEAEPPYVKTIEIRERVLGEDHPETLASMNSLASLYNDLGRYDEAEPLCLTALQIKRRVLGEEHPDRVASMNNLGVLYMAQGRYGEAEPLDVKTLEIQRRSLGDEHPDALTALINLATLYNNMGRNDEAEPRFVNAIEIMKRVLGEEHPKTLTSMHNLALLYSSQSRGDEAESLFVQVMDIQNRILGEEHPDTLDSMSNLANLYIEQGRYDAAERLHVKTLKIKKRVLGAEHPATLFSLKSLAGVYQHQERWKDAEPLQSLAPAAARRVWSEDVTLVVGFLADHGRTLVMLQRFMEAESEFIEAYQRYVEFRGEND